MKLLRRFQAPDKFTFAPCTVTDLSFHFFIFPPPQSSGPPCEVTYTKRQGKVKGHCQLASNPDEQLPVNSRYGDCTIFHQPGFQTNAARERVGIGDGILKRMLLLITAVFFTGILKRRTAEHCLITVTPIWQHLFPFFTVLFFFSSQSCCAACVSLCICECPGVFLQWVEVSGGQPRRRSHSPRPNNGHMYQKWMWLLIPILI